MTTGITFQGLNMNIGHMRCIRWVKDDNPQRTISAKPEVTADGKSAAKDHCIAYNKMRGQYASTMERALLEQSGWTGSNADTKTSAGRYRTRKTRTVITLQHGVCCTDEQ
ncbi:MAG: hypothetical protein EON54_21835 [Alcaligenaceae bacterium]|nr:MAG: hypothetical protein EON54_21835 [Alcaligenaceae bacterium]